MKAFNSRKTSKQHWLFKKKHHTLSIMSKGGYVPYLFKTFLREGKIVIRGQYWGRMECSEQLGKIIINSKKMPISQIIELFEKTNNIKIKDLGLTRKDFSGGLKELDKIKDRLDEYKKNKKEKQDESVQ